MENMEIVITTTIRDSFVFMLLDFGSLSHVCVMYYSISTAFYQH